MPAPKQEEDVVVPLHLQPVVGRPEGWRARSGSFVAVALVGFVTISVLLGTVLNDEGPSRSQALVVPPASPTATARTTPLPTPTPEPRATPLPTIEVVGGHIPTERRLVYANGLQVLDLASGTLEATAHPLYDAMLPIGPDQLICACLLGGIAGGDTTVPPSLRFGRFDLTGTPIVQRDLLSFDDVIPVPDMTNGFNVVTALSPDRATLYVLTTARRPPVWSIDLYQVNVETGQVVADTSLGRLPVDLGKSSPKPSPSPSPVAGGPTPDGVYLWANSLTAAPNGRTVFASVQVMEVRSSVWASQNPEWMVPIRGGHPGTPIRIKPAANPKPDDWCIDSPTFIDSVTIVQVCVPGGPHPSTASSHVRRLTTKGESLGDLPVTGMPISDQYPPIAIVDTAARAAFVWDPERHAAARVDLDGGTVALSTVPDSMLPPRSQSERPMGIWPSPGLVLSPDGARLYALGMSPGSERAGSSTGIWVFGARTLDLLDHWEPRANLVSLAVSADGRFVYAAGAQGFDVEGHETSWPASVTVYDAASGEIQVVYGAVSQETWITFPDWQ